MAHAHSLSSHVPSQRPAGLHPRPLEAGRRCSASVNEAITRPREVRRQTPPPGASWPAPSAVESGPSLPSGRGAPWGLQGWRVAPQKHGLAGVGREWLGSFCQLLGMNLAFSGANSSCGSRQGQGGLCPELTGMPPARSCEPTTRALLWPPLLDCHPLGGGVKQSPCLGIWKGRMRGGLWRKGWAGRGLLPAQLPGPRLRAQPGLPRAVTSSKSHLSLACLLF